MVQDSNVILLKKVLAANHLTSLTDLVDRPELFCIVFKETFSLMKKTLLSGPEDKIPTPTLTVIRDDLFTLTSALLHYPDIEDTQLKYPGKRVDNLYPLDDLVTIVDAARADIIEAIGVLKTSSANRSKKIQKCRNKIIQAIDAMKEFEARRV